jgi:hypothetical protein
MAEWKEIGPNGFPVLDRPPTEDEVRQFVAELAAFDPETQKIVAETKAANARIAAGESTAEEEFGPSITIDELFEL